MGLKFRNRSSDAPIDIGSTLSVNMRCLGYGLKTTDSRTAGQLNMGPNGLGMLLTSGYLADAGVFYCPSASGMRSDDCDSSGNQKGRWLLEHWKTAGGLDANALMYGNWQPTYWGTASVGVGTVAECRYAQMVQGSYHYRDVLINIEAGDPPLPNTMAPPAIKPKVYAKVGQPLFRSLRQLGARAVVCDTFSKGSTYDALGKKVSAFHGVAI